MSNNPKLFLLWAVMAASFLIYSACDDSQQGRMIGRGDVYIASASHGFQIGADSFSLAVLPDTQVYSVSFPGLFDSQTAWIARNVDSMQIRFVMHLGDVVNNNTALEWYRAQAAMSLLDDVVPYGIAPGNHDYGFFGDASNRNTLFNNYFPFYKASQQETFGGAFETNKLDNTYSLFTAGGKKWIVLFLEWAPRPEAIAWANTVMENHMDRLGILVTHAYLFHDDTRYDHINGRYQQFNTYEYATPGGMNDGEELWQNLVRHHWFVMTFSGHVLGDGTGYLVSTTDLGNTCHQMLSNYQMRQLGGEGYMRILEITPSGHVSVRTYSPLYDSFLLDDDQQFEFDL